MPDLVQFVHWIVTGLWCVLATYPQLLLVWMSLRKCQFVRLVLVRHVFYEFRLTNWVVRNDAYQVKWISCRHTYIARTNEKKRDVVENRNGKTATELELV